MTNTIHSSSDKTLQIPLHPCSEIAGKDLSVKLPPLMITSKTLAYFKNKLRDNFNEENFNTNARSVYKHFLLL